MTSTMSTADANRSFEGPSSGSEDFGLMTGPAKAHNQTARVTAPYENKDERFRLGKRHFGQYAQMYFSRLQRLVPHMRQKVTTEWPGVKVNSVLDMVEGEEVAVIGTLYKEMKLKPSILSEYTKDRGLEQLIGRTKFTDAADAMVLEDESARVQLRGSSLPAGDLVTGVVVAVRGSAVPGGEFWVTDVLYPGLRPQKPVQSAGGTARYVAFLSGLAIGEEAENPARVSLLLDFLTGMLGSMPEQITSSQIVRTVIAGGLMSTNETLASAITHTNARQQHKALAPVREVDMAITELAGAMPVDIMPGASDPASRSLPQQPLHHCLFPGAAGFQTLLRVTNPHDFQLAGHHFLGSSGQNVDDVYKYSCQEDRLAIMEAILEWGHLVPTAPDTLSSYPFAMDDPFLLEEAPHVFFAGNQPEFQTRMVTGAEGQRVRLLCLPKFSETGTLVLLNLDTLDVHPIHFDT